ncbi:MAG: lipoprotein-releasing system permease protein [Rhodospirillaceae bacterium]|nr:MAG: lipoprotein-releasing system permease protein [Rhodospirillaceae bacterium]
MVHVFSSFEWMVALRYLRARRKEGFVSVIAGFSLLGISLGVATLIIVMAVMSGFREELLSRILGLNGHLSLHGPMERVNGFEPLAASVRTLPGVVRVIPTIGGQVMATSVGGAAGAVVRGMHPEDIRALLPLAGGITAGSLKDFQGVDVVMIGERLASRLGLHVGDPLTLISPKGNVTAFGTVPRLRAFRIVAIFNVGMYEYDSAFVYMPLPAARLYFDLPADTVSHLEIMLDDPDKVTEVSAHAASLAGPTLRLHDWQRANASFFNAIQVERNVMFLILTLIILVAAFNIISGLIMLVKDKGRDIAILRTMGATRGMILRIFFLSGASIGLTGTALGVGLGLLFSFNIESIRQFLQGIIGTELFAAEIYFLSHMPAKVDPDEVVAVVLMALGLSFCATFYPSWRAARLDPVEALRYE